MPKRGWFIVGGAVASLVAVVFAVVGDGVQTTGGSGIRAVVADYGHTLVWVLLALAFGVAALSGVWGKASARLAVSAGLLYVGFLLATL